MGYKTRFSFNAHVAKEEQNKQNQRSEGNDNDNLEVTQKGAYMEFDYG